MRFEEALAELEGRQPQRMIPTLDRIRALADLLGQPQLTYPTIHVTGTNGKTTTARLITSIACAHGLSSGLYTSPHLDSVTERLRLCGEPIGDGEFAEAYEHVLPFLEQVDGIGEERVTYFETLTALAFLWFADKPVALGVFEVGMGGTWDATNLVAGDVAVLGQISLDHPELGSTVAEVAQEKAGIVKPGKVAVSREQAREAMAPIEARCGDVDARLLVEGRDFALADRRVAVGGQAITVRGLHASYEQMPFPMFGEHAASNAALAIAALEAFLDRGLSEDAVREALDAAASPGRIEVVDRQPLLVLDGAHNPAGADALAAALSESFIWERIHVVLAVSRDKDLAGIARALAPLGAHVLATRYSGRRAAEPETLAAACRDAGLEASVHGSVDDALTEARGAAGEGDLILVTGSLYTVADARRTLGP